MDRTFTFRLHLEALCKKLFAGFSLLRQLAIVRACSTLRSAWIKLIVLTASIR